MGTERGWSGKRFALVTVVVAAVFVACAWFTQLRLFLHAGLLALVVVAFFPFVVIAALVAFALVLSLATAFVDGPPPGLDLELLQAPGWVRAYYRFVHRFRFSAWVGVPAGAMLGCLVVWGLLAAVVIPREAATGRLLLRVQKDIEGHYREVGDYPVPSESSHLQLGGQAAVADSFGRPLRYEVRGRWKAKSYQLVSYGADGVPSSDDLCVEGKTRLQKAIEVSASLVNLFRFAEDVAHKQPLRAEVEVIRALRCEHGPLAVDE